LPALVDIYTDAVYSNLRPLRGNWEPTQPIELGDFGLLDRQAFQRIGNISQRGITIGEVITDDIGDQKIFASGRDTTVAFHAKAASATNPAVTINASVEINFATQDSAFFNASGCSYSIIRDKVALGTQIMSAYKRGKWPREWAVITDLVRARKTTVAISGAAAGGIVLEADGSVAQIDLAKADIGLSLRSARNVGYQVIAQAGLAPLIGMSQIQPRFLWWFENFRPLTTDLMLDRPRMMTLLNSTVVETEPKSDLYFGQLL
jgi:hypothetical protein